MGERRLEGTGERRSDTAAVAASFDARAARVRDEIVRRDDRGGVCSCLGSAVAGGTPEEHTVPGGQWVLGTGGIAMGSWALCV